jgi:hypothetical protein
MDPFLWNILKFKKKLKQFGEHLIREKNFWYKKIICPHVFLVCLKHIKKLLEHGEFSWKFCSCNIEIIRTYFLKIYFLLAYYVPMVIFQNYKKIVFKDWPHIAWLLFSCFHPFRQASHFLSQTPKQCISIIVRMWILQHFGVFWHWFWNPWWMAYLDYTL